MRFRRRQFLGLLAACATFRHAFADAAGHAGDAPLPDWSAVKLEAWNYDNPFTPSEWNEEKLGDYGWKLGNARIVDGALELAVTEKGSGQLISGSQASRSRAKWEVDVTVPEMRPGLIAAPLWVFNKEKHEEIDFEFVGERGLQLNVFADVDGEHKSVWLRWVKEGDLSGQRFRLAIDYTAGERIVFSVDGETVATVTPNDTEGNAFPKSGLKPYLDLWPGAGPNMDPAWAGKWVPMQPTERRVMIVHGYRQS